MITDFIHPLARFNFWANHQILERLQTLTEDQLQQEIVSSFPSIVKTVVHIHGSEDVWRQRLQKIIPTTFYKVPENSSGIVELSKWIEASDNLSNVILSYDGAELEEIVSYVNIKGEAFSSPRWQMIHHAGK